MATKFLNGVDLASQKVINLADPTSNTDGANKQYVDAVARGLSWKRAVRAASTGNVSLSSAPATLDGVSLSANDRVLLKDQTTATENGIYVYASTGAALTRATDAQTGDDARGMAVSVDSGTINNDRVYTQTADPGVIGTASLSFSQLGGAGTTYTAGAGLNESPAGTFNVTNTDGSITVAADTVSLGSGAAGAGLTLTSGVLDVAPGTGLEINADTIRIATSAAGAGLTGGGGSALAVDTSVVARKFSTSVGNGSLTSIAVTHSLGTQDVVVSVQEVSTHAYVVTDWVATSTSVVTLSFAVAPTTNQYRVTVIG